MKKIIKWLKGKTIKKAEVKGLEGYDDKPFLDLDFTDGSMCRVEARYGGYTGKSENEYPRFIEIKKMMDEKK